MSKWWKNPKLIGTTAYWLLYRIISKTMRIKVQKHSEIDQHQPYIFLFWHGKQLLPSFVLTKHHFTQLCALVSSSRDGEIATQYLQKCGFEVLRGSSRKNNVKALIELKRKYLSGASIGSGIDGPIGPRHVIKPGFIYLAQKFNIKIIPIGSAYNNSWTIEKAWDKFQIPKPFSNAALVLGQPYTVPQDMEIDHACTTMAQILLATEQQAMDLIATSK